MNQTIESSHLRRDGENQDAYIYRICELYKKHDAFPNWRAIQNFLNEQLGMTYDESAYRKKHAKLRQFFEQEVTRRYDANNPEAQSAYAQKAEEMYKVKQRARDATREHRSALRKEARLEELEECIRETAKEMPVYPLIKEPRTWTGNAEGIAPIGDWHAGACEENVLNTFNKDILRQRVEALAANTIGYCRRFGVRKLTIPNLGDMIEGAIHITTRVTNELDSVQSTIFVAELIAGYLLYVERYLDEVTYSSVVDNHSRLTANYKEHIEAESFGKFVDWWLEERLARFGSKVKMVKSAIDDGIGEVTLRDGRWGCFVHGHEDRKTNVVQHIITLTKRIPDFVIMGHTHSALSEDQNIGEVFVNGNLKGVDRYGVKKRYYRRPSQKLIVFEDGGRIDVNVFVD